MATRSAPRPAPRLSKFACAAAGLAALAGSALMGGAAKAEDAPPFAIERYTAVGSGCRQGTAAVNVSPDRLALTVLFDDFVVEATPTKRLMGKVCDLDLSLNVPSGWAVALATTDTRGYASLQDNESFGQVRSLFAFSRTPEPATILDRKFTGPFDENYQLRNEGTLDSLEWSPCGGRRMLRLRTRIQARLAPRSQNGSTLITVDSLDHAVTQKYALQWKRCGRDDGPDVRQPPRMQDSLTATCQATLMDRRRNVLATVEGTGAGLRPEGAKMRAMMDALKKCRSDRRGAGHGAICERGDERACTIEES